jgi:hypothetical protein
MAGICSAAVTHHYVVLLGKDVYNLSLAFITPLQAYNAGIHNLSSQNKPYRAAKSPVTAQIFVLKTIKTAFSACDF